MTANTYGGQVCLKVLNFVWFSPRCKLRWSHPPHFCHNVFLRLMQIDDFMGVTRATQAWSLPLPHVDSKVAVYWLVRIFLLFRVARDSVKFKWMVIATENAPKHSISKGNFDFFLRRATVPFPEPMREDTFPKTTPLVAFSHSTEPFLLPHFLYLAVPRYWSAGKIM